MQAATASVLGGYAPLTIAGVVGDRIVLVLGGTVVKDKPTLADDRRESRIRDQHDAVPEPDALEELTTEAELTAEELLAEDELVTVPPLEDEVSPPALLEELLLYDSLDWS